MKGVKSKVWAARVLDRRVIDYPAVHRAASPSVWVEVANPIWQAIFWVDEQ